MDNIQVRPAVEGDEAALAALVTELGYPSTIEQLRNRLARIAANPDHATFVAEKAGAVIGMVGVSLNLSYDHDTPVARLTGVVVTEGARGNGVGGRLLLCAEEWARERGAHQLALTSHLRRIDAHTFYRRRGFEETGRRFAKQL